MRNQNIEIAPEVFTWYTENFTSARQTMTRVVTSAKDVLESHPVADLFQDPVSSMEFMLQCWKNIYRHNLSALKGMFTRGELSLFIDTHNSTMLSPWHYGSNTLAAGTSDSITLDGTAERWEVDPAQILEKIHALSPTQAICLELWAVGFWYGSAPAEERSLEKYVDQLA
jgi:hypothetical protein